jgi:hypothetical protein
MPVLQPIRFQPLTPSLRALVVRFRNNRCPLSKKTLILHPLKANIMQLQKALIYFIIFVIFLLGIYEIKSGNIHDFTVYKNSTDPVYMTIPGNWLVFGALGLFMVISHTFSKIKN